MTMHTRQKIRDAIKLLLVDHPDLDATYTGRVQPNSNSRFPMAVVESGNESSSRNIDQWRDMRTLQVAVRLYAEADEHLDDVLDALAVDVENLLGLDQTLGGIAESFDYKGCDPDTNSAARQEVGCLVMQFECVYLWTPSPELDPFTAVQIGIDMANPRNDPPQPYGPDGQIDAQLSITLPA